MRTIHLAVTILLILGQAGAAMAADLAVGDRAPDFTLQGSDGRTHRLGDYAGKEGVVLAWFPRAFTPG